MQTPVLHLTSSHYNSAYLDFTPWFRTLDSSDSLADVSCVGEAPQVGVLLLLLKNPEGLVTPVLHRALQLLILFHF